MSTETLAGLCAVVFGWTLVTTAVALWWCGRGERERRDHIRDALAVAAAEGEEVERQLVA